jgi:phosphomannomutase
MSGEEREVIGDRGNVMAFTFTEAGNTRVTARPSGTEPKIKYYVSATSADIARPANEDLVDTKAAIDELAEEIAEGILEAADAALETQQS